MTLNIKDPEAHKLARKLADRTGETMTRAVTEALRERLARDFGEGRHPAGLNYGDFFSYALSKVTWEPLLFKGKDFAKTDLSVGD